MKLINPADLADMDIWSRDELLDYIYSNDPTGGCIDFHLSTPTKIVRRVAMEVARKN